MKTESSIVAIIILVLIAACVPKPDPICKQTDVYKQSAVNAINTSASHYVGYSTGSESYEDAEHSALSLYLEFKGYNCDGPSPQLVVFVLESTWKAIQANEASGFTAANSYVDRAFNASRNLHTVYGWKGLTP